jgi:GntR family transcriptional regulator
VHEADSNRPDGTGTSGRKPLKYRRIADDLRSGIRRGDYEPGRPLPGENDLMARYKVARMTVRQALAELQREGLAIARRGSGVYVSDLRPIVRDELGWLATMPWLRGEAAWKDQAASTELQVEGLGVRLDRATEAVAEALEIPPGAEVWARSGRSALEGRTVALTVSWLPRALVEGTRATAPTNVREDVRARPAISAEAEQLALSAGAPVLVVRRLARAGARPVELSESVLDASVHVLRYELPAGSEPTLSRG